MKIKTLSLILTLLVVGLTVSACGGKRAKTEKQTGAVNTGDITQPPSVVKEVAEQEVERDAGDTISYEEWLRKRDAQSLPNLSSDE